MSSPTQRSLKLMRDRGHPLVQVVEKWVAPARRRIDLFGLFDVLCVGEDGSTIAVQTTSDSNVAARITKITDSAALPLLRRAGWVMLVHGWKKRCGRWICREVDVS